MGSGWGATSYQAGRGPWSMAKGLKSGEPVGWENFVAFSAQTQVGGSMVSRFSRHIDNCAPIVVWWLGVDVRLALRKMLAGVGN